VLQKKNLVISSLNLRAQDDLRQDLDETLQRLRALEGLKGILTDTGRQFNLQGLSPQPLPDPPVDSQSPSRESFEAKEIPATAYRPTTPSPGLTAKEVLDALEFDPSAAQRDCETLLRMRAGPTILSDNRLLYIIRSFRLRAWLEIDESAALLINGGGESRPDSEASYIAAKLVESLLIATQTTPCIVALAYFCGQHRHLRTDVYASPSEMAMSLLLQLVHAHQDSLTPGDLQTCLVGLDPRRIGSICDVLEKLVDMLGGETFLFVVLDSISFFAHPAPRQQETAELLRRLTAIQRKPTKAIVKLLFTSPSRAIFVEQMIDEYEIINVPQTPPSAGKWNDSVFSELFGELKDDADDSSDG